MNESTNSNPGNQQPDAVDIAETLRITHIRTRSVGGVWADGTVAGHRFQALVFPEPPTTPGFEIPGSRISKLWLRDDATGREVAHFERGWDREPATEMAKAIVDLLAAGLAETVFSK